MNPYRVDHETIEPRIGSEKTVEEVKFKGGKMGTLRFTRIAECVDVWAFEEYTIKEDVVTDWKDALTRQMVGTVLKCTPCVEIRDKHSYNATTIGEIEYSPQLKREGK